MTWNYQVMAHQDDDINEPYYAIHEYYQDFDCYTENPVSIDADSVEGLKWILRTMLEDIEKHGIKEYKKDG